MDKLKNFSVKVVRVNSVDYLIVEYNGAFKTQETFDRVKSAFNDIDGLKGKVIVLEQG